MTTVKSVQERLPTYWTDESYPDSFNSHALPHRHFNHAVTHAMKALGRLAALSDALDHGQMQNREDAAERAELMAGAGKWLADLVICSARMAQQLGVELDGQVHSRIETIIERHGGK